MTLCFKCMKPALLAIAILFGLALQYGQVHAAERTINLAGGCFWCTESDFESVNGVKEAVSGFTGGDRANPTYKQVSRGGTGHREAVQITYDDSVVSLDRLFYLFFRSVDPTDAGGQFCDRGEHYSTAIYYSNEAEKAAAEKAKRQAERELGQKIVTPILPAKAFYPSSAYHQDYYKQTSVVLTRRGPKTKAEAYKFYRNGCGRDQRVKELWGSKAPFVGKYSS